MKSFIGITIILTAFFSIAFAISVGWELGFQFATSTGIAGAVG